MVPRDAPKEACAVGLVTLDFVSLFSVDLKILPDCFKSWVFPRLVTILCSLCVLVELKKFGNSTDSFLFIIDALRLFIPICFRSLFKVSSGGIDFLLPFLLSSFVNDYRWVSGGMIVTWFVYCSRCDCLLFCIVGLLTPDS